jgi:hypothetical protein
MGCQRDIAAKIVDREAHYILALKGNQGNLQEQAEESRIKRKTLLVGKRSEYSLRNILSQRWFYIKRLY